MYIDKYNYREKIIIDGEPNRALMWVLLRNTAYKENKTASNDLSIEVVYNLTTENTNLLKHESLEKIIDNVEREVESWNWYDKKLYKIYTQEKKSIRQISKDTEISVKSIFLTLKDCKDRIREAVGEDYCDYLNTDYELI